MAANLFLTGPMRYGKSTILCKVVQTAGVPVGGFFVQRLMFMGNTMAFRLGDVAGEPYIPDVEIERLEPAPDWIGGLNDRMEWEWHPESFEQYGTAILRGALAEARDLILLDELGRVELKAPRFMKTVFAVLDSSSVVLGVLKPESNHFLDAVRSRDDVRVLDLAQLSHQTAAQEIQDLLQREIMYRRECF